MTETWLLLDVSFLAYRAFHTTGHLSHKEIKTGVIYGILRDVGTLQDTFNTRNCAFCFDSKHSLRKEICSTYKKSRKKNYDNKEKRKSMSEFRMQLKLLRMKYLPTIGYKNIFLQKGYEADDLIAAICNYYTNDHSKNAKEFIIVSSDSDMFQILNSKVSIWNPITKVMTTQESLFNKYGVDPCDWPAVRSLAGGKDDIVGVEGVGLKTACKYVATKKATEKVAAKIKKHNETFKLNMRLLSLPFLDEVSIRPCRLVEDSITRRGWEKVVVKLLGLKSLKNDPPIGNSILKKELRKGIKRRKPSKS